MPEFYSQAAIDASRGMDAFTRGYIGALYFTESGDYDDELTPEENSDNGAQFDVEDELSAEAIAAIREVCEDFQQSNCELLAQYRECTGRDDESAASTHACANLQSQRTPMVTLGHIAATMGKSTYNDASKCR